MTSDELLLLFFTLSCHIRMTVSEVSSSVEGTNLKQPAVVSRAEMICETNLQQFRFFF